jgi:signal peptidase I
MSGKTEKLRKESWIEWLRDILIAAVIMFFITQFVAEANVIPTVSMRHTLETGDRVITNKLAYRFSNPQRGDIVVFFPPQKSGKPHTRFIKRIIGLPGETIEVKDGRVIIGEPTGEEDGRTIYQETELIEDYILEAPRSDYPRTVIPEDSYFVMGDNRNKSTDSRVWDFVSRDRILGKSICRFWPPSRIGRIYR